MMVAHLRFEAGEGTKDGKPVDHDADFRAAVERAINNPPANHFFQDLKYDTCIDGRRMWQSILVIYGELPTT